MAPAFDFDPPEPFAGELFRLEVLGPEHNERDYEAWTSSMDHIHATHGFETHGWPEPMSLADNLDDMLMHKREYELRTGYTYSILQDEQVVGCVYIYPPQDETCDARVRSWVRVSHADLDQPVRDQLRQWLDVDWPFSNVSY